MRKIAFHVCADSVLALLLGSQVAIADVKIGVVVSATGPASFLGDPQKQTVELYDKGGINGEPVKLILYDDGSDANASRTFATRLVEEDKVDAVCSPSAPMRQIEGLHEGRISGSS